MKVGDQLMTSGVSAGEALASYLKDGTAKLNGTRRRWAESQAERFVTWWGKSKPVLDLKPYDIESFVASTVSGHSSDAGERVEGLRHFLDFLNRSGYTPLNLKKEAKVPRVKGMKRNNASREETVVHRLTAEGHASLTRELEELKAMRSEIQQAISAAREDKDFRENAPLDAAREKQAFNEARIKEIESILKHSQIIESNGGGASGISIGSTITVHNLQTEREQRFTIVHPREVDPTAGKISVESPVGKAVLGRGEGDEVEVQAPAGVMRLKIKSVDS
jgi:transcription elongation factor GreA